MSEAIEAGRTKQEAIKLAEVITGKKVSKRVSTRTKPVQVKRTNFGGDVKEFLEKICGYDLMSPEAGIKLKLKSVPFTVNKEDVGDVILILANSYNREMEFRGKDRIPLDKNELFKKKIFQLLEYNIKLAEDSADLKSLESITRMYNSIQEDHDLGTDFEIVYKICSSLKPGVSRQELISLIKQYSK